MSVLLGANPYDGSKRQAAQRATQRVLGDIEAYDASRCCQRDSWLALRGASRLLEEMGKTLPVSRPIACEQYPENRSASMNDALSGRPGRGYRQRADR